MYFILALITLHPLRVRWGRYECNYFVCINGQLISHPTIQLALMLGTLFPTLSLRAYRLARRESPARNVADHYNELSTNVTVNHQRYFKYEVGARI